MASYRSQVVQWFPPFLAPTTSVTCRGHNAPNCASCLVREGEIDPDGCGGDCALNAQHHCVPSKRIIFSSNLSLKY